MQKQDRYHVNIYNPEWVGDSLNEFITKIISTRLHFSVHAKKRYKKLNRPTKTAVKILLTRNLKNREELPNYLFEYYCRGREMKKACFRFPIQELDIDIILVLSTTGKVVTLYRNNYGDTHKSLKTDMYMKGVNNHE